MSTCIGLSVALDVVCILAMRRGRVIWASKAIIEDDRSVDETIADLIATVPGRSWHRTVLRAAIGPSASQVRRLSGLPPLGDESALRQLVAEGSSRFFLRNGSPLVITGIGPLSPGEVWAAALDASVVEKVISACRMARCQLVLVAPAAIAAAYATDDAEFSWSDGELSVEVRRDEHGLIAVRRCRANGCSKITVRSLSDLGDEAPIFGLAYGAAMIPKEERLTARSGKQIPSTAPVPRWRVAVAGIVLMLSILAYAVVPPATNLRRAAELSAVTDSVDREWRIAVGAENELARVTEALTDLSTFAATPRPAVYFLSELANALPERSVVMTLDADTTAGTLVVLTPRAAISDDSHQPI